MAHYAHPAERSSGGAGTGSGYPADPVCGSWADWQAQPVKGAVDHDARLHHRPGYLFLGCHHPGDFASDSQKWGICAGSCFYRASVRHYPPGWFNLENYRLFSGHYCLPGHARFNDAVCRLYFHAGYCHGGRPGCARRRDHGRHRGALFNAGL